MIYRREIIQIKQKKIKSLRFGRSTVYSTVSYNKYSTLFAFPGPPPVTVLCYLFCPRHLFVTALSLTPSRPSPTGCPLSTLITWKPTGEFNPIARSLQLWRCRSVYEGWRIEFFETEDTWKPLYWRDGTSIAHVLWHRMCHDCMFARYFVSIKDVGLFMNCWENYKLKCEKLALARVVPFSLSHGVCVPAPSSHELFTNSRFGRSICYICSQASTLSKEPQKAYYQLTPPSKEKTKSCAESNSSSNGVDWRCIYRMRTDIPYAHDFAKAMLRSSLDTVLPMSF